MPKRAENFITKLEQARKLIAMRFPEMDMRNLVAKMGKLGSYHYNKKRYLLFGKDREFYNFLIENSYNPFTVYRWLLLERVPEEIKWQLKSHQINQRQAMKLNAQSRVINTLVLSQDIKEIGMKLVGGM